MRAVWIWILLVAVCGAEASAGRRAVVAADSKTGATLPGASVFDREGRAIGMSDRRGRLPYVSPDCFPVTVRYLGYRERSFVTEFPDTVFLDEVMTELPEVVVETREKKVLHILAYVREYSTLSTYTDTVFLFREKMVDYMLTPDSKMKFRGWTTPRVLSSKSYYRFTDGNGLDSVSDTNHNYFSWSDWIGLAPATRLPAALRGAEAGSDTLQGRYSPAEIWNRNNSRVTVDVDVLADERGRRWVPDLGGFFRKEIDFERFRVRFTYDNVAGDTLPRTDLTGYSYTVESRGRDREMFMFNRSDEPVFVSTYAEVYVMDKEYITVKEAKKWDSKKLKFDEIGIYAPPEAPPLQASVQALVDRVEHIDRDQLRIDIVPDHRLVSRFDSSRNFSFGYRLLSMLKALTGISSYRSNRNLNNNWDEFRRDQIRRNHEGR